jgi:DNA-binding transcriptional MerR regulator
MARNKTSKVDLKAMSPEDEVVEDQHSENVASIAMKPSNRMAAMSQAINLIGTMSGNDINHFMDFVKQMSAGGEGVPDGTAAKNQAGIAMKPSMASPDASPLHQTIKEDLAILFGDSEGALSEEFKSNLEALFEASVSARVGLKIAEIQEALEEQQAAELDEALSQLTDQFNQYITYVAEEWIKSNEVAIESTLKSELTEDFIGELRQVFLNHNIDIPDEKVDVVETLSARVAELEDRLNESMNNEIELNNLIDDFMKEHVIDQVTEGLVLTQKEKFRTLIEGIEFNDPDSYGEKLNVVKTRYFAKAAASTNILNEDVEPAGDGSTNNKAVDPEIKRYLAAMPKTVTK